MYANIKSKIFNSFDRIELAPIEEEQSKSVNDLYFFKDPFDFYRVADKADIYIPKTQKGLRMAFISGTIGIEFFLQMATSLRPLADEAQDIDEITRLFSQQKLSQSPTPHSVKILINMIQDPNPEIALYAAEGLSVIENSFIQKIQRLKERISSGKGSIFINHYSLGILYLRFSRLLDWQPLIKKFYLKEALANLEKAFHEEKNHYKTMMAVGEIFILINRHSTALEVFKNILSVRPDDYSCLMRIAESYYFLGLYDKIEETFNTMIRVHPDLDKNDEIIVYQWLI